MSSWGFSADCCLTFSFEFEISNESNRNRALYAVNLFFICVSTFYEK
jgi:hypothetical protein